MLPAGMASGLPVTGAQYAKAVEAANLWAYTTVGNLKLTLGVDTATSKAVMRKLQADGIIGSAGSSGIALTQKFVKEQAAIAARTAKAAQKAVKPTAKTDLSEKNLSEKAKELVLTDEEVEEPHSLEPKGEEAE